MLDRVVQMPRIGVLDEQRRELQNGEQQRLELAVLGQIARQLPRSCRRRRRRRRWGRRFNSRRSRTCTLQNRVESVQNVRPVIELAFARIPRLDRADLAQQLVVINAWFQLLDELFTIVRLFNRNSDFYLSSSLYCHINVSTTYNFRNGFPKLSIDFHCFSTRKCWFIWVVNLLIWSRPYRFSGCGFPNILKILFNDELLFVGTKKSLCDQKKRCDLNSFKLSKISKISIT